MLTGAGAAELAVTIAELKRYRGRHRQRARAAQWSRWLITSREQESRHAAQGHPGRHAASVPDHGSYAGARLNGCHRRPDTP